MSKRPVPHSGESFGASSNPPHRKGTHWQTRIKTHGGGTHYDPAYNVAKAIADSLNPDKARVSGRVRTLNDMTPEERAAIEAQYGAKIDSPYLKLAESLKGGK